MADDALILANTNVSSNAQCQILITHRVQRQLYDQPISASRIKTTETSTVSQGTPLTKKIEGATQLECRAPYQQLNFPPFTVLECLEPKNPFPMKADKVQPSNILRVAELQYVFHIRFRHLVINCRG